MQRILLIGSNRELTQALQTHRPLAGCAVETCPGNVEMLRALHARSYTVVLTDPQTPVREDLALAEEIRTVRPGVRTIVLTPEATPEEVLAALKAKVFAVFSAPFRTSDIAGMVEYAIHDEEAWREGIQVRSGLPHWITLRVSSNMVNAERLLRFMTEYRSDLPGSERVDLMVAFREILLNAMEHGAGFHPERVIEVTAAHTARTIVYHFRDPGPGFDLQALPQAALSNPPDDPLAHVRWRSTHDMRPGGFGILLAKHLVDELMYNESGNEVLLIKYMD
jgi:anti-sigma regulatory factor (Ser/Thr protein kinase)/ActR/RegA family two-component response regulator